MIVTLQLAGGSSYGWGEYERFDSIAAAKEYAMAFWGNRNGSTPCADDCEFRLYLCPPESIKRSDPYPDEVWTRGKRGGVARSRC